mmetsp:Transcript_65395/g.206648  ORF Transcript_65395/g.206648 Transcript_65395/m.206648 type:complete len:96 (-) Transcript_65395:1441-1728(-)
MVGQKAAWLLLALLATASLIGPCAAVEETALAENEEAQADGLEAPNEVVSATVTEADPVDLQSGTGDVSTTGELRSLAFGPRSQSLVPLPIGSTA